MGFPAAFAALAALGGAVLAAGCSCTEPSEGLLATDTLPAARSSVHTYSFSMPASGDLDLSFDRQDGRDGYAGSVYLFVTTADCTRVTDDPQSLRDGQHFTPLCSTLANSYKDLNCCVGHVTLAAPARLRAGTAVKVFVYGLNQPGPLPYTLRYQAGDRGCGQARPAGPV